MLLAVGQDRHWQDFSLGSILCCSAAAFPYCESLYLRRQVLVLLLALWHYRVEPISSIARICPLLFLQWMRTETAKIKIKTIMKLLIFRSLMRSVHFNVMWLLFPLSVFFLHLNTQNCCLANFSLRPHNWFYYPH